MFSSIISLTTVQQLLNKAGLNDRKFEKIPFLVKRSRKARPQMAKKIKKWLVNYWAELVLSDESSLTYFELKKTSRSDNENMTDLMKIALLKQWHILRTLWYGGA